jgi:WD40 repeat protein/tetratricopeptide (TPR) repeat protein
VAFRNLTEITPDGQVVRRPVTLTEICDVAGASAKRVVRVLDEFRKEGRCFLMPPISEPLYPDTVIDISHESLIRQWPQLAEWTKDEEKARQTDRMVAEGVRKWEQSGRDRRALLAELPLMEAEEWAKTHPLQVRERERELLRASRDQVDRQARRWRVFTAAICTLAVVASVLLVLCYRQLQETRRERNRAVKAETTETEEKFRELRAAQLATEEAAKSKELLREVLENKARGLAGASRRLLEQGDSAGALALAVEAKKAMQTEQGTFDAPKEVDEARLSALGSWKPEPTLSPSFAAGTQNLWTIAATPDGRWLVAGGPGSAAQLRHLEGGSRRRLPVLLEGHSGSVDMVAISEDGLLVATLDHSGVVRLWAAKSAGARMTPVLLPGDLRQADLIALSPDGLWLAAGGKAGAAWLWPLKGPDRSAQPFSLAGHGKSNLTAMAFSRQTQRLATADSGGVIQLWDLTARDKAPAAQGLAGHSGSVTGLAFSPNGQRLASVSVDGSARLWPIPNGSPSETLLPPQPGRWLWSVALSPDGRRIAIGANTGQIEVRDLEDSRTEPLVLSGAPGGIEKLGFSPGAGRWLAAQVSSGRIGLWDLRGSTPAAIALPGATYAPPSGQLVAMRPRAPAQFGGFAFRPEGQTLITLKAQGGLLSWDLSGIDRASPFDPLAPEDSGGPWCRHLLAQAVESAADRRRADPPIQPGELWPPAAAHAATAPAAQGLNPIGTTGPNRARAVAAFAPDGHRVALAHPDGTITLWDATAPPATVPTRLRNRGGSAVSALSFSPARRDGQRWLAAGDARGVVRLWDLAARDPSGSASALDGRVGEVLSLAFSPDGRWLAAASAGHPARLWDLADGPTAQRVDLPGNSGVPVQALAFDPAGSGWLAAGTIRGEILLWKLGEGLPRARPIQPSGFRGAITQLLFTAEGGRLIAASQDGLARLWAFSSAGPGRADALPTQTGGIFAMAVVPDAEGRWLATGGRFGDVRLWRLLDGEAPEFHPIPTDRYRGAVAALAFSGDGRRLAIATDDRSVRVVAVDPSGPAPESSLLLGGQDEVSTSLVLDRQGRLLLAAVPRGSARVWPLQWLADLDQLVDRLAVRNLAVEEWEIHFAKKTYQKTFPRLPVHPSVLDACRNQARQGQREAATQKLLHLVEVDPGLDIEPGAEIALAAAEYFLETGRLLARRGPQEKAIEQFAAARQVNPRLDLDPTEEARKYAALEALARVDELLATIRSLPQSDLYPRTRPVRAQTGLAEDEGLIARAQDKLKEATELNDQGRVGLTFELGLIGRRLKALMFFRKARSAIAAATLDEAVKQLQQAVNQDPVSYPADPKTTMQRLVVEIAQQADADAQRVAGEGRIVEAAGLFDLARRLQPGTYKYVPEEHARQFAAAANATSVRARLADQEGRRLAALGRIPEAIEPFRTAHELDPDAYRYNPEAEAHRVLADRKKSQADSYLREVEGFAAKGRYDMAESTFEEARKLDPSLDWEPRDYVKRVRARLLIAEAKKAAQALQPDAAIPKFQQAQELDHDLELSPERLARGLAGRGWLEKARSLAASNPTEAVEALRRAWALLASAGPLEPKQSLEIDPAKQVRLYAVLSAAGTDLGSAISSTGTVLCGQGKVQEAYTLYERACEIDPLLDVSPSFWNLLGWKAAVQGRETAKVFSFASDLAVAREPGDADYRDTRGLARALRGDRAGAIKDFQAFLAQSTDHQRREERLDWIRRLRAGQPVEEIFTPAVLQRIRDE